MCVYNCVQSSSERGHWGRVREGERGGGRRGGSERRVEPGN